MSTLYPLVIKETLLTITNLLEIFTKVNGENNTDNSPLNIGCWDGVSSETFTKAAGTKNANVDKLA